MATALLQSMVEDVRFDSLPAAWNSFDLETFSTSWKLWDYQRGALENATKALWKYYQDLGDFRKSENTLVNDDRKTKLYRWYEDNDLDQDLDIKLAGASRDISNLLADYYESEDGSIPYQWFINRMCFWMATGSGKSLILVKLIQVLRDLMRRTEIPAQDILVLTHRDDLIDQLKLHVDEFNGARDDLYLRLRELKEYPAVKRENRSLLRDSELTVFYYRSDNLSNEQKEKIVDFRNYDNHGKWYVLLDEAHKGDKEDSKRQHIYAILARNGFLFNFSATFTDPRDLVTTVYNFNLSEFIKSGYGKHIAILQQEIRAFRDEEDYTNEEKQKVVLSSLIMLAYVGKFHEAISGVRPGMYHKPLLLVLVNSVNIEDADLKLFFRELVKVGKGEISEEAWQQAKDGLWNELKDRPTFIFEDLPVQVDQGIFQSVTKEDLSKAVFNSGSRGEIEILLRPSNKQELALKLKTCDKPFALIKIGDISDWLKEETAGYEVNTSFDDESYFHRLNQSDSDINILMGSRSFYEGWDSNRPNVMNFINIGTGTEAKKFILQSVGRGVRIEPVKNKRKRLVPLHNGGEIQEDVFQQLKDKVLPLETLFIFGTNRQALKTVIQHLDAQKGKVVEKQLALFLNTEAIGNHRLLVPVYKLAEHSLSQEREQAKFEITPREIDLLKKYVEFIGDDRVLLALHGTEPTRIGTLKGSLRDAEAYYKRGDKSFKNIDLLVGRVLDYFSIIPQEFERLKALEEEIKHFRNIKVSLEDVTEVQGSIQKVRDYPRLLRELEGQYGKIPRDEYLSKARNLSERAEFSSDGQKISIEYSANHYYVPLILSREEKIGYVKHIIKTRSEVKFISYLEDYLKGDHKFKEFDWWLFSKLDESLDEVYLPYYDSNLNRISRFKPDFIFWLQKGDSYFILFVDPKGIEHLDWQRKIDGYKRVFEHSGKARVLDFNGLKTRVFTFLYTSDVSLLPQQGYKKYWFDEIGKVLDEVLKTAAAKS